MKPGQKRRAAVSSFGFGGTNAHVLVEEAPEVAVPAEREELFLLSAPTPSLLAQHAKELAERVEAQQLAPAAVARTLASRTGFDARVAFVAKGRAALVAKLNEVASGALAPSTPVPEEQRQVAFLFAGQGAQRVGLLKDLVERFPALRARLAEYDAAAKADAGCSILDALYPQGDVRRGEGAGAPDADARVPAGDGGAGHRAGRVAAATRAWCPTWCWATRWASSPRPRWRACCRAPTR